MNITLFGATGKTGKYLMDEGKRRGIKLTVFARSGSLFQQTDTRTIRGDLTDRALVREAIRGADAVLSALGPTSPRHPKDLPITRATETILAAMTEEHVTRFIAISTGTAVDPGDGFDWKIKVPAQLIRLLMPGSYRDIIGMAKTVRASPLEWTMVRVALLKDLPASHRLNVGLYGHTRHSLGISRADVASFMFDQAENRAFIRQSTGISASMP
jgi:putative NADH-flavin reductase